MINDDTVLEVTENRIVKTRYSEKQLLARRASLVSAVERFQAEIEEVDARLGAIQHEKREV